MSADILIVDDEADIRDLVAGILQDEGYDTRTARNSDEALAAIVARRPNLVFLDIWLQGSKLDGLQLLDAFKQEHPEMPVVMISGHGNIETAVAAIKHGAYDFIEKPFKADRLVLVAERALETSRLKREVKQLKQMAPQPPTLVGQSAAISQLRQTIERVAPTNSRILIVGPSGAGKELAARTIHQLSARANGPFIVINAAAITPERMEIELFGVDRRQRRGEPQARRAGRGAWRHAVHRRHRRPAARNAEQDPARAGRPDLPARRRHRQGRGRRAHRLVDRAQSGSRDRRGQVPRGPLPPALGGADPGAAAGRTARGHSDLVDYFMDQISQATGLPKRRIGEDAMAVLQSHNWPGNVRQLRNNIERLMILAGGDPEAVMDASMLPPDVGSMVPNMPNGNGGEHLMGLALRDAREVFEREYLVAQISRFGGNISRTAEFVGMERSALHRKLKALGIG